MGNDLEVLDFVVFKIMIPLFLLVLTVMFILDLPEYLLYLKLKYLVPIKLAKAPTQRMVEAYAVQGRRMIIKQIFDSPSLKKKYDVNSIVDLVVKVMKKKTSWFEDILMLMYLGMLPEYDVRRNDDELIKCIFEYSHVDNFFKLVDKDHIKYTTFSTEEWWVKVINKNNPHTYIEFAKRQVPGYDSDFVKQCALYYGASMISDHLTKIEGRPVIIHFTTTTEFERYLVRTEQISQRHTDLKCVVSGKKPKIGEVYIELPNSDVSRIVMRDLFYHVPRTYRYYGPTTYSELINLTRQQI